MCLLVMSDKGFNKTGISLGMIKDKKSFHL